MQRTSKLNQTAKLSILGNVTSAWKWHHWKVSRLLRPPLSLGFSGMGSTPCREVANFACKFQSMSSKQGIPGYFKGSDSGPPPPPLYHSCSRSSFGFWIPTRHTMKFNHPFGYALHTHGVPSILRSPPIIQPAYPLHCKHTKIMRQWDWASECRCVGIITYLGLCLPTRP